MTYSAKTTPFVDPSVDLESIDMYALEQAARIERSREVARLFSVASHWVGHQVGRLVHHNSHPAHN